MLLRGFHFFLHTHLKKQIEQWQPCLLLNQFLQATLQTSLLLPLTALLLICHYLFQQQKQCFRSVHWVLLLKLSDTGYKFPRAHWALTQNSREQSEWLHFIVLLELGKWNCHSGFDEKILEQTWSQSNKFVFLSFRETSVMLNIFEYTFFGAALPYSAAVTVSPAIENEILFSIWDFLPRTYQVRTTCSLKPLCVEYLLLVFMLKIASLHRSCMSVLTNSLSLMDSGRIFFNVLQKLYI